MPARSDRPQPAARCRVARHLAANAGRWTRPLGALLVALLPASAAAHARWFAPNGEASSPDWSLLVSAPVAIALLSGIVAVAFLAGLQRLVGDPLWPRPAFSQRLEPSAPAILGVQTAITMIFMASRLDLFVPTISLPRDPVGLLVAAVAVVAAFSFVTGVLTRVGAAVTVGLVLLCFAIAPWYQVLEQAIFVGIAVYLFAVGRGVVRFGIRGEEDRTPLSDRLLPIALPALRIAAGVSVLVLAFTEKLLDPELGVAFLREYPFNFLRAAGLAWFTDERFAYLAGIVEATAGFALLAGFLPRVVILGLWLPFNVGIAFLPAEELIGHLPILSTMYVLLVRGTEGIPPPVEQPTPAPYPAQHPAPATPPGAA